MAKVGEGLPTASVKGVARRKCKRNMTTNFTQRDVLKIFGEDQDVGIMELNHMEEALNDNEQVVNAAGTQKVVY